MKNMKRLIAVMMVLTLALCFVACTDPQTPGTSSSQEPPASSSSSSVPASSSSQQEEDSEPSHTVLVLDQDGNPVAGVAIQLCDDGTCYRPIVTNENGVAEFFMDGITGAKAKFFVTDDKPNEPYNMPGYTIDPNEAADEEGYVHFGDSNTITLTLTKVAE